jgi:hypothetical protein
MSGYEPITGSATSTTTAVADCPSGKKAVGGGFLLGGDDPNDVVVRSSGPANDGATWRVTVADTDASDGFELTANAVCVTVTG